MIEQKGEPLGKIVFELDIEKAPYSCYNFIRYAEDGYYNDTIVHRVIPTFMIQGGGFTADMDVKKEGLREGIPNEWKNGLKNMRGTVAMARQGGKPDSATSQFFINVVDNERLDRPQRDGAAYAVFGKVVEGMDVVDKIRETPCIVHPKYPVQGPGVTPDAAVIIKSVKITGEFDRKKLGAKFEQARRAKMEEEAALKARETKKLTDLIAKIETETGKKIQKTESGLMYVVLEEGDGPSPKPSDTVEVHYTGWLVDGTKFDSSRDRGSPASFRLTGVISGWTEGVGLMKVGGKHKLVIPYELAYGERGRPPTIPPKATLVFDIELLGIK